MTRFALGLGIFALAGCPMDDKNGDSVPTDDTTPDDTTPDDTGTDDPTGNLRVLHIAQGVAVVDVFADDAAVDAAADLDFRDGTGYLELPAATYDVDVAADGDTAADAILTASVEVEADVSKVAVAYGRAGDATNAPALGLLTEDASGIDAANVRLQVIHAGAGIGPVNILNAGDSDAVLISSLDYWTVPGDGSNVLDLPADTTYTIGIDADNDNVSDFTYTVDTTGLGGVFVGVYAVNVGDAPDVDPNLVLHVANATGDVLEVDAN